MITPTQTQPNRLFSGPWKDGARNRGARVWRRRCEDGIKHVLESLNADTRVTYSTAHAYNNAVDRLVTAIFMDFPSANPADRTDLLHWLGRAVAIEEAPATPWGRARGIVINVTGRLMCRWAASAWLSVEYNERPSWAESTLDIICRGGGGEADIHDVWAPIPPDCVPRTSHSQPNAQMDLLTFLDGYISQAALQINTPDQQKPSTESGRKIAPCFLAFRILGIETQALDTRVRNHLNVLGALYDQGYLDPEILRMTQVAEDRKILNAVGEPKKELIEVVVPIPPTRRKI